MVPDTLDLLKEQEKRGEGVGSRAGGGGEDAPLASTPEQFTCARSAAQRRGTPVEGERKRGGRRGSSGTSAAGREREGKRIDGVARRGEGRDREGARAGVGEGAAGKEGKLRDKVGGRKRKRGTLG